MRPKIERSSLFGAILATVFAVTLLVITATPAAAQPTCSGTLGIAVHGQHVVRDYVSGGKAASTWPPSGSDVGGAVAGSGAALPGGPGPGFHFRNNVAPGASFCLDQSRSPDVHRP